MTFFASVLASTKQAILKRRLDWNREHRHIQPTHRHIICLDSVQTAHPDNHLRVVWCCLKCGQKWTRTMRAPRYDSPCDESDA